MAGVERPLDAVLSMSIRVLLILEKKEDVRKSQKVQYIQYYP